MELPDLGTRCTFPSCGQLDFLPFKCINCKNTYCLEHRTGESHKCPYKQDKTVPVCPLCSQIIVINGNQNVNAVIDAHIQKGCPTENSTSKLFKCSLSTCKNIGVFDYQCKSCNKSFCDSHRMPEHHKCDKIEHSNILEKANSNTSKYWSILEKISQKFNSKSDDKRSNRINQILNQKNAKGISSIPKDKRYYLCVVFPQELNKDPCWMFFHKEWVVGKVLDSIVEINKIPNLTNNMNSRRLKLVNMETHSILQNSIEIQKAVPHESNILIEYEDILT